MKKHFSIVLAALCSVSPLSKSAANEPAIMRSEFIFEKNPVPSCHATTIVEANDGALISAWFAGTREGDADVGVWSARCVDGQWTAPVEVANGIQSDGTRLPCWNPVLFQPKEGPLLLFYKIGPNCDVWWGMVRSSFDNGKTWSVPVRLPDKILGPIKNKPVQLADGTCLSGSSWEGQKSGPSWQIHFERSSDNGKTWQFVSVPQPSESPAAIQPSILVHAGGSLQALGRTKASRIFSTISNDNGLTWAPLSLLELPNPNSGIDAVTLKDGRHVLIYNHTTKDRSPLNVAISKDGRAWEAAMVLEDKPGEYSYPAVIQTRDGLLHFTYTWKRSLAKHVVVDPSKLTLTPMVNGEWPAGR